MTIGAKRTKPIQKTAGPGEYNGDKADAVTKARAKSALIGQAKRPNNFADKSKDPGLGPGAYKGATSNFG